MTRMTPETVEKAQRAKIVKTALSYLGSKQGGGKHKHLIDIFNTVKPDGGTMTYVAYWCAAACSAWAIETFGKDKAKKFFPLSWSCETIIKKAKAMGIFKEKDSYKPEEGDWILYDWDDSGKGDNKGGPDHVGLVEKVSKGNIKVIEGNKNKAVGERIIPLNGKYIRGFVTPKYDEIEKHSNAWYFFKTTAEIIAYMRKHHFRYEPSWKDNALTWDGAKKQKTSNCSTMICYALQEAGLFDPGMYFWINGDKISYRGKGTKKRLDEIAKISHPHKPPQKCKLKKGDIVGYADNAHTMEFAGWDDKDRPLWYSYGRSDVGDKQPKVKHGKKKSTDYNTKKIMTLIRLK